MKIKKTHLWSLLLAFFLIGSIIYASIEINASDSTKHYVTAVNPASYTDIVEFYGNSFVIDDTQTALCIERDKGTPYPGIEVTLLNYEDDYINKILYYGYNGPEEWDGFYNDDHAILCTSMMLSEAYSNYGYKDICDDFKAYLDEAPDAPEFSLYFSPQETKTYPEGDIQRTDFITLVGDNRLTITLTLESGMEIHFIDGTTKTGTITLRGGDTFYISATKDKSGSWYSGELYINEVSYSTILAQTESSSMQDLMYLTPDTPIASGELSIEWYNKGSLEIIKSSSSSIVENNNNYSLEGAIYKLYKTYSDAENDTNSICTLKTDKTGYASASELDIGTYYLKEVSAPEGYYLSSDIISVTINSQTVTTKKVSDTPLLVPVSVILQKQGSDKKLLSDAQFKVTYYPVISTSNSTLNNTTPEKTWIIKTDSNGYACLDSEHLISGDTFYTFNNTTVLPIGTITIEEIQAPIGYKLDSTLKIIPISPTSSDSLESFYNPPIIENVLITQPFQITKYGESYSESPSPLSGAGFMACPIQELETDQNGNYIWDSSKAIALTQNGSKELFTDENGYALSIPIPYGTYMIRETTVPTNYYAVDDFFVNISEDSDTPQKMLYFTDECFKAHIKILKEDSASKELILNNSATFKIWSFSEECYVSFEVTENGETFIIDEFHTDSTGTLLTPGVLFPGKYLIEEIIPPDGYAMLSSSTGYIVEISDQIEHDYLTDEQGSPTNIGIFTVNIPNTAITGQIEIIKEGESEDNSDNDFIPLEGIVFDIYADENIYSPDGQGNLLYENGALVESITTGQDGRAISSNTLPLGKYIIIETNTPEQYIESEPLHVTLSQDNNLSEISTDTGTLIVSNYSFVIKNYLKEPEITTEEISTTTTEEISTATTEEISTATTEANTSELEIATNSNALTAIESASDTVPKTGDSLKPFALTIICIAIVFFMIILIFYEKEE